MLIALHKPYGVLSQFTPEPGSAWKTLADLGPPRLPPRVYPLGRLDADSEGLLLLSDEPGLNTRLLDPRHAHEREYWALVERVPSPDALARLAAGVRLPDHACAPSKSTCSPTPRPPRSPRAIRPCASAKTCPMSGSRSPCTKAKTVRSAA